MMTVNGLVLKSLDSSLNSIEYNLLEPQIHPLKWYHMVALESLAMHIGVACSILILNETWGWGLVFSVFTSSFV